MFYAQIVDPSDTYFDADGILKRDDTTLKYATKAERDAAVADFNADIEKRRQARTSLLRNRDPEFMRSVKSTDLTQRQRESAALG